MWVCLAGPPAEVQHAVGVMRLPQLQEKHPGTQLPETELGACTAGQHHQTDSSGVQARARGPVSGQHVTERRLVALSTTSPSADKARLRHEGSGSRGSLAVGADG